MWMLGYKSCHTIAVNIRKNLEEKKNKKREQDLQSKYEVNIGNP